MKKSLIEFDTFNSLEEYQELFEKWDVLRDLGTVPFTLRLVLTIMPEIKQFSLKYNKPDVSKYDIYKTFSYQYYKNEAKRLAQQNVEAF